MNVLFVHQNFPGQYVHIARALASTKRHVLVALRASSAGASTPRMDGVQIYEYKINKSSSKGIHPWASDFETKVIRGEACALALERLLSQGFVPDLICVHPGWGEALFLKTVCPHVPVLAYQELFYNCDGTDIDFDPELQGTSTWATRARLSCKNASPLLSLDVADWGVTPTRFQHSTYPDYWREKISVIHDGIDLALIERSKGAQSLALPDGTTLQRGDKIVTFVNRRLEPYRGCHTMIRAIPHIQADYPDSRIVIVGRTEGVSYGAPCPEGEWKDVFLAEIDGRYDPSRVHFTGPIPHDQLSVLFQLSSVHVYLTYPFVLSWSLLEALASGCAVVGSATAPVMEVIEDGFNGLLIDFFNPAELAAAVGDLLASSDRRGALGQNAVLSSRKYALASCLPKQLALLQLVADRAISNKLV